MSAASNDINKCFVSSTLRTLINTIVEKFKLEEHLEFLHQSTAKSSCNFKAGLSFSGFVELTFGSLQE